MSEPLEGEVVEALPSERDLRQLAKTGAEIMGITEEESYEQVRAMMIERHGQVLAVRLDAEAAATETGLDGLWISDKHARMAEYQKDIDELNRLLVTSKDANKPSIMRVKQNALRAAAEELGDLPARIAINQTNVQINYVIEGVDMDKLR